MARNTGRHIAHFAAGGYASPTAALPTASAGGAYAQGMPAPTAAGGYTPGPETNAAGSWGAGAQSGGIAGDTTSSPVGAPDLSAFNQPGNYVAPPAALPAAAPNVYSMAGGYNSGSGWLKDGGTVQNMKRGGKVRQMTPNGKPGSSQPTTDPNAPQGRPSTPLRAPLQPQAPQAPQAPSGIPAGPAPPGFRKGGGVRPQSPQSPQSPPPPTDESRGDGGGSAPPPPGSPPPQSGGDGSKSDLNKAEPGEVVDDGMDTDAPGGDQFNSGPQHWMLDDGGGVPDTGDMPVDADQGQEGQAGDQAPDQGGSDQATNSGNQQSGPSPAVQSALTAARAQFGLNDNIFNNMQLAGATPQTPTQQNPTQQHPTQQGGGGFPDNQTKGTLDRLKQLPGLENQINSGPQRGATPQTPSQQRTDSESDEASAAGGGAIPEENSDPIEAIEAIHRQAREQQFRVPRDLSAEKDAAEKTGYGQMRPSTNIEDNRVVPGTDLKKLLPNQ